MISKYGTVIGNIVSVYKSWCPLQCSVDSTYLSKILRKLVTYICAIVCDVADKHNLTQWSIYFISSFPFVILADYTVVKQITVTL